MSFATVAIDLTQICHLQTIELSSYWFLCISLPFGDSLLSLSDYSLFSTLSLSDQLMCKHSPLFNTPSLRSTLSLSPINLCVSTHPVANMSLTCLDQQAGSRVIGAEEETTWGSCASMKTGACILISYFNASDALPTTPPCCFSSVLDLSSCRTY